MLTKFLIAATLILVMHAAVPMDVINFIGKFAIGWMLMDIVSTIVDYRNIGKA